MNTVLYHTNQCIQRAVFGRRGTMIMRGRCSNCVCVCLRTTARCVLEHEMRNTANEAAYRAYIFPLSNVLERFFHSNVNGGRTQCPRKHTCGSCLDKRAPPWP